MITVLGASGNTGGRVARRLREAGQPVRAVGRDAARLADVAGIGAEAHVGDITDAAFLADAFRGADAAYVLMPLDLAAGGYRAQQEQVGTAITAALGAARVPRVVALSAVGADVARGTGFLETLHEQEQRLGALDAQVTVVRPGLFFESFLPSLAAMQATGVHHDTIDPAVPLPMVATVDVGDAAGAALLDPAAAGVREVHGPEDLTVPDAVARLGAVLGTSLRYERVPEDVMRAALVDAGLPPDVVTEHLAMNAAFNDGTVHSLAGRSPATTTPTSIEDWARSLVAA
ncbi:NmrA family NAD(P)-binding protein [Actinomycetospora straminea]|uniref:NAD(P)H-binding protein n=1 Tax=Actinomycetospora straminea TaxID=663607 RepID=A0ABP9DWX2_9PSEU|nr:NmrA family NAD(P)-binding protein [Actinomycetospora straminea]MDD7934147.1 NmrA family NAD(P)-binding protein [Actinomycetospora straminea]